MAEDTEKKKLDEIQKKLMETKENVEKILENLQKKDCRQLRSVQEVLQAMPTWISISCLLVKQTGKNI